MLGVGAINFVITVLYEFVVVPFACKLVDKHYKKKVSRI